MVKIRLSRLGAKKRSFYRVRDVGAIAGQLHIQEREVGSDTSQSPFLDFLIQGSVNSDP